MKTPTPAATALAVARELPACWWLALRCAAAPWLAIGYLIWHNAPWRPARGHR